jgi:HD-GYP domain-containing protein (c-di-GMP phosphodiesterase class II)
VRPEFRIRQQSPLIKATQPGSILDGVSRPLGLVQFIVRGYCHDIGKLVIPDSVLLKPGRLDADEWAIMKTHSCKGGEIARSIPTLTSGAIDVIHHHHERWDGAGYPDGLSGEKIPLVARIISVCDVYDALTSVRPYKEAWSVQEAKAEIERQAGTQFDPRVVHAFLPLVES